MAGDTFNTYYGEFLISPIPIELSFNYCSHSCQYCFANLNKPDRKAGIQSTMNLLKDRYKRKSFEAFLLREQYPVLISNRVDPFAVSNYRQALPIMRMMTGLEIPIALQTKGGRGIDEALEFLPPSCWYISIMTLDDQIRQQVEPGAPSIGDRLALIETLVEAGHSVSVGINPAVPEWLGDPDPLTKAIAQRGAHGAWIEPIHFNPKQIKAMGEKGRSLIGKAVIDRGRSRRPSADYLEYLSRVEQSALSAGLEIFAVDYPARSDYWKPFRKLYKQAFPTHQEFINHLADSGIPDGAIITLDQYLDFLLPHLPEGDLRIGHYVGATAHNVCREFENWDNVMSYDELLMLLWNDGRIKLSPQNNQAFSRACDRGPDGKLIERFDEHGDLLLVFSQKGFDNYQVEV